MKKNLGFRAWFYFRQGWATYFAFILAAINTLVTTYYLAIKNVPSLQIIFPSFIHYAIILSIIGIPILVAVGYIHYKKINAFSSEMDITVESNPYMFRIPKDGWNQQVVFPLYLMMSKMMIKWANNEKLSEEEIKQISEIQKKIDILIKGGSVGKMPTK